MKYYDKQLSLLIPGVCMIQSSREGLGERVVSKKDPIVEKSTLLTYTIALLLIVVLIFTFCM